jgi:hypothetical protein
MSLSAIGDVPVPLKKPSTPDMGSPACHHASSGNPAISKRSAAFRPCLTAGLALSWIMIIALFMRELIITERIIHVHIDGVFN